MEVYNEPEAGINPVISLIRDSERYLNINCYLIDDDEILRAISEKVEKKVNVRIIIDGHPYDSGGHTDLEKLRRTGAQVNISPSRFDSSDVFDHAKYMYNEKKYVVGTMNLTQAGFKSNREYFVIGDERKVLKSLERIFESDWKGERAGESDRKFLIVSPDSQNRLLSILTDSRKLSIETEELGNDKAILSALRSKGNRVRMILPSSISESDLANAVELEKAGVKIKLMPSEKLYMHAKMINAGKFVFIGSQNFSDTSLLKNREVGIKIYKHGLKKIFKMTFKEDWKTAANITRSQRKEK